jgi:hypothetical protein
LTGDEYEISFTTANYFLGSDGEWHPLAKKNDMKDSYLNAVASWGDISNTVDIKFEFINNSIDNAFADGMIITFPENINIISAPKYFSGWDYITPQIEGQQVIMGLVNDELSQNGVFRGGETWNITVQGFSPPINLEYLLKDDGSSGNIVDVNGMVTINEIAFKTKTENYWNLRNISTDNTLLSNQTMLGVNDYFSGVREVDGFQINMFMNYHRPKSYHNIYLNSEYLWGSNYNNRFNISDYSRIGAESGKASHSNLRVGTSDVKLLGKDYLLRFTGVLATITRRDRNVEYVVSGGQKATLYGAEYYSLKDHPLNPKLNSNEPFTIQVPFEVWSVDDNKQINILVYDNYNKPLTNEIFQVWSKSSSMHSAFVLSVYNERIISPASEEAKNYATWNLIWDKNDWENGDTLEINYLNPISTYDKFTFTVPNPFNKNDFGIPDQYYLLQNYPNPFNPNTTIRFRIPEPNLVKLEIFNILGQQVRTLVNDFYEAGTHHVRFNSSGLSSGVYFYRIESGNYIDVKKMLLLK